LRANHPDFPTSRSGTDRGGRCRKRQRKLNRAHEGTQRWRRGVTSETGDANRSCSAKRGRRISMTGRGRGPSRSGRQVGRSDTPADQETSLRPKRSVKFCHHQMGKFDRVMSPTRIDRRKFNSLQAFLLRNQADLPTSPLNQKCVRKHETINSPQRLSRGQTKTDKR